MPAPEYEPGHPLQAHVTNLDASPYLGRLALCRVQQGTIKKGHTVAWCKVDGTIERVKLGELFVTRGLDRVPAEEAGPGELIAIAGIDTVTIGETLADPDDPRPLPVITVDEPSLAMTIGINTSPLSGQSGNKLTARLVKSRLDQELVGNVSLRVLPTERPDAWEVQGRGELQLAVLVEIMRREGFELTVGKPQVVHARRRRSCARAVRAGLDRRARGAPRRRHAAARRAQGPHGQLSNHGTGWARLEYIVPARGLIGFRTEFMTETRGTGILHHVFEGYGPWCGPLRTRRTGSLVSDRRGYTTNFALMALQERSTLFMGAGVEVYEGMVVGENSRSEDMDVNPTREKKLTNMRASASDDTERLTTPTELTLEQALEFIADDECRRGHPRYRSACARPSSTARSAAASAATPPALATG